MRFFLTLIIFCYAAFPAKAPADTTGALSGRVLDASTGAGIVGALVTAESPVAIATVRTDARGYYLFISLPPGNFRFTIDAPGYDQYILAGIIVVSGFSRAVNVRVSHPLKEITLHIDRSPYSLVNPGQLHDTHHIKPAILNEVLNVPRALWTLRFVPGITTGFGTPVRL